MVLSSSTTSMFLTLLKNDEIQNCFVAHIRVQHATSAAAVLRRKFSQLWYHTEVHRLDNSVITTLSCSVNNRSHHKWLSEQNRLIFCSIYNFIWSSCEIWKLHQNYLLMFIVKLISEPSWAALFIFLVQLLVLKVKCRNKYLQPRKRSHVWRLVRVEKFCQDYKVPPMVHHPHLNTNHVLLRPLRSPQSEYTHTIIVVAMDSIIIVNAICDMFIE